MGIRSFEHLRPDLIALGFGYFGKASEVAPDPEKTILDVLRLFSEDPKLYRMLLAWMDRFGDLIHVERLSSRLPELSETEKLILGVTALKRFNAGDHRFKSLSDRILKLERRREFLLSGQDEYLIEKNGIDSEFEVFGIRTSKISPSEPKKLMDRQFVIRANFWLRLRTLLGTNFRADVAFVRMSQISRTAYSAMKFLRCSKETSYRIWNSLDEAELESMIAWPESAAVP